ncbi:PAS domain S-box protein, partial [Neobacillus sp. K501]
MRSIIEYNALFAIYKSFFDLNEDACYALDLEGNFILFNEAASRLTGYPKEEILLKSFISFIPDNNLSETIIRFKSVLEGNQGKIST